MSRLFDRTVYQPPGLPVSKSSYLEIEKHFCLPGATLLALSDNEGCYSKHPVWNADGSAVTKIGFIIKAAQKQQIGNYMLSISYDIASATTTGLVIGDHASASMNKLTLEAMDSITQLRKQLQFDPSLWPHPCALVVIMLQVYSVRTQAYLDHMDAQVKQIESANGVVYAGGLAKKRRINPGSLTRSELLSQMIHSHTALTELIWIDRCTAWTSDSIDFILEEIQATSDHLPSWKNKDLLSASRNLVEGLLFIKSTSKASRRWSNTQIDRIKSQVNVLYAFIAQQDSQLNAMIAVSSGRDSAAMKILAVITTVFLPGTYISTLFSMGMFNWPPGPTNSWISPVFWIYWTVTVPLTLLVIGAWRLWWKRQDEAYKAELSQAADSTRSTREIVQLGVLWDQGSRDSPGFDFRRVHPGTRYT